jgi:small GTP-binding protein
MSRFKIAVLGGGAVGKTGLISRLTGREWSMELAPTIEDRIDTSLSIRGETFPLTVIDTAGPNEMEAVTCLAIREADTYVIVYSVTSRASFREAETISQRIIDTCPRRTAPKIVLAGNMCDAPGRTVPTGEGEQLAKKWGCPFHETAAIRNWNATKPFRAAVKELVPRIRKGTTWKANWVPVVRGMGSRWTI